MGLFMFMASAALLEAQPPVLKPRWDPGKTLVFIVGTLQWQNKEEFSSFPLQNRRDAALADFFKKAGVPENKVVYLQDKAATLSTIRQSLNGLLKLSAPGDTLILYYCGHGYPIEEGSEKIFFASYDAWVGDVEGWAVNKIVSKIEADFKGNRAILLVDCCHSGGLIDAVKEKGKRLSYACFVSSETDKSSTGNWTFTESVLSALRGEGPVDRDRNGWVSVEEMQGHLYSEMAFAEDQKSRNLLTGEWKTSDLMAAARKMRHPREGEQVEVLAEGEWWTARILDGKDGKFQVFYYGYEADEAEWVEAKRIRKPAE